MPEIASLRATITADTGGFEAGMQRAERGLNNLAAQTKAKLNEQALAFQRFGQEIRPIIAGAFLAGAAGLGYSIKKAVDFDSLKRGLTSVAGSAAEAEKQLISLKEVAKLPGLGFEEAIQGSVNLQAAGVSAKAAEEALMGFGNALATVGRGKAELDGVVRALTQMSAKGKIMAQEINQIAERVPQIRQILTSAFGTSSAEEIENLGLTFEQFLAKVNAELAKLPKVSGGAQNSLENMMDAVNQAAAALGTVFLPAMESAAAAISGMATVFASLPQPMQTATGWLTAVTLALGLLTAATFKAIATWKAWSHVVATGVFTRIGAGLAAWGVTLSAAVPAIAAAGVAWTLMAASAVRAFAASEQARGEIQRVAAIVNSLFIDVLDRASGSVEKLRAEWAFAVEMFGQGKVPTAIVEGFRKEVEKLGFQLTDTAIIAKEAFAKMAEAARDALATFRDATLAIGQRAQSGAIDRLEALKEQLAATNAAINKITTETVLPQGVSADEFLKAAAAKKKAEVELNRLIGIKKQIETDILKIEKESEASKKRQADWLKQQEEAARKIQDYKDRFNAIIEDDLINRDWADVGLRFDILKPLEAAELKLQSIRARIEQLFRMPPSTTKDEERIQAEILRGLKDYKNALIQVAAAEKILKEEAKARDLAQFYANRRWKDSIENVLGLAKEVSRVMGVIGASAVSIGRDFISMSPIGNMAHMIDLVRKAADLAAPAIAKLSKQNQTFSSYIQDLNIKLLALTKGQGAATKAALMLNDALSEADAEIIMAKQRQLAVLEEIKQTAEDLANSFADAFINGLMRIREEGFSGLLRAFEEMLLDMAMAFLRSYLVNLMTSFFANLIGGGTGSLSNGASSGGSGQSVPVPHIGDFQGGGVTVYMTVNTPDAKSFKNSDDQLAQRLGQKIQTAMARNW